MTAPREFEVTRSAFRVANRRGLILIVGLIIPLLVPLMPFYIDFSGIINVAEIYRKLEGPGALFPFIALTAVFLTMRSIRDKPSTIRLLEGGIKPAWASRKLFVLEGRPCVYPWVPASVDTAHGACVELWCGRRSFIVGARGVSKVDLLMDAPAKRGLDCEVSRDVFFKILQGVRPLGMRNVIAQLGFVKNNLLLALGDSGAAKTMGKSIADSALTLFISDNVGGPLGGAYEHSPYQHFGVDDSF